MPSTLMSSTCSIGLSESGPPAAWADAFSAMHAPIAAVASVVRATLIVRFFQRIMKFLLWCKASCRVARDWNLADSPRARRNVLERYDNAVTGWTALAGSMSRRDGPAWRRAPVTRASTYRAVQL